MSENFEYALEKHTDAELLRYDDLKKDIQNLTIAVNALTETWNQAKGVLSFIKWILGIAGGLTVFFAFMKDHWR